MPAKARSIRQLGDLDGWASEIRALRLDRVSPVALVAVLWKLAQHCVSKWEAWPSIAEVAEATTLSHRQVKRALAALEELGAIVDTGERRGRTKQIRVWRIVPRTRRKGDTSPTLSTPPKGDTQDTLSTVKGCHPGQERVTPRPGKGDTSPTRKKKGRRQNQLRADAREVLAYFNLKRAEFGKRPQGDTHLKAIEARLREHDGAAACRVIDHWVSEIRSGIEWSKGKPIDYFRAETVFRRNGFASRAERDDPTAGPAEPDPVFVAAESEKEAKRAS